MPSNFHVTEESLKEAAKRCKEFKRLPIEFSGDSIFDCLNVSEEVFRDAMQRGAAILLDYDAPLYVRLVSAIVCGSIATDATILHFTLVYVPEWYRQGGSSTDLNIIKLVDTVERNIIATAALLSATSDVEMDDAVKFVAAAVLVEYYTAHTVIKDVLYKQSTTVPKVDKEQLDSILQKVDISKLH